MKDASCPQPSPCGVVLPLGAVSCLEGMDCIGMFYSTKCNLLPDTTYLGAVFGTFLGSKLPMRLTSWLMHSML